MKTYERFLHANIISFLSGDNIFKDSQHGFLSRRSTPSCVLEALNIRTLDLENGYQINAVYFDFSKAFDLASHHFLLSKPIKSSLNE